MSLFSPGPAATDIYPDPGLGKRIQYGFDQGRNYIEQGTLAASDFLRQGYEDLFRSRAQGMIGGFNEMSSRVGAQTASQGLSPDVVQRMLFAPGQELQANLGAAQGEAGSGLAFDLAKLFKGTSSELAGLTEDELSLFLQKEVAKRAANQAQTAGMISAGGSIVGGLAGNPGLF
jgi:hypothetical protein